MKSFLFSLFLCAPLWVAAQTADSAAVKQVDSLLRVFWNQNQNGESVKALEAIEAAEKLALSTELGMGPESASYGSCCHSRGNLYYQQAEYSESEKWFLKALAIRKKALGELNTSYASTLANLAVLYNHLRQYEKAEPIYLEAITIWEKTYGKAHPSYAVILNNLAGMYSAMGRYEKAEPIYLEAKANREQVLGTEHPDYAWSLNSLANLYADMGQYEKAERLNLEAKSIREKVLGKEHPDYAWSLNSLANLYRDMGQYEKAEPLLLESMAILEHESGKEHLDFIWSLNNLAVLYGDMGQYEKAEPLLLEAKAICEKILDKEDPDYATSLNNLASSYADLGQYEKAESLYLEAKTIREKSIGKEHPDYVPSLNNLAILYRDMGLYEKAEPLFQESKAILGKVLGKEHPDYATSLNNLGITYTYMGQFDRAEPQFLEAITIREKNLGKEHPDYAVSLNSLANLYADMGQYEKAELLYLEAKTIREKNLGNEHPDYAMSLNNLATLYMDMGQYAKAEPLCLESLAIFESVLGKDHPNYASNLNILAVLYMKLGQYEKAEPQFLEFSIINRALIGNAVRHLSEWELKNYLSTFSDRQDRTLSFVQVAGNKKLIATCYDNSLFYKGFLLHAAGGIRQLALANTAAAEKLNRLKGLERRLAALYTQPIAERDGALTTQLETQANDLEKDLARIVAGYAEAMRQVQWQEVQTGLKPGEAAIEFVHYRFYDKKETDSTMYAALVLRPGFTIPQFIPLFEEKTLAVLLQHGSEKQAEHINTLYQNPALYTLLWQPLEQALAGAQTVWFSPGGLLHRLNLRAIATPDGDILADRYRLIRLNSTRQLAIPSSTQIAANDALVYGGIQYDMDAAAIQKNNASLPQNNPAGARGYLDFHNTDSTLRAAYSGPGDNAWKYLPFTEVEAGLLQHDLQEAGASVRVLSGYAATEESFKAIRHPEDSGSPRILHLATHGFFFPDPQTAPGAEAHSFRSGLGEVEPVFRISEHPMIRSGLLMAGANQAWSQGRTSQPGMEDGILTAYEISQMDLSNTELAVLSACETGLGDIAGNEGVYGLQRAFKIAGTRYLLMSLWQVPDLETQQFMTTFYRHWLKDGQPVPDAYRATQQEMRERFKDPYLWAGFVLVE